MFGTEPPSLWPAAPLEPGMTAEHTHTGKVAVSRDSCLPAHSTSCGVMSGCMRLMQRCMGSMIMYVSTPAG